MALQLDLYRILPKCAGGIATRGINDWEHGSSWADSLDGNAPLTLILPDDSEALADISVGNICRLIEVNAGSSTAPGTPRTYGEWRFGDIERSIERPLVTVTGWPLL